MYAARLADDEASTPVTWWYIPVYFISHCSLSRAMSNPYLLPLIARRLLHQVNQIWRTELS